MPKDVPTHAAQVAAGSDERLVAGPGGRVARG